MQRKYQKFSLILIIASLIPLLSTAIINLIIDPYGVFAFPIINNINNLKPKQENAGRIYKAFDIRRIKPKIIILGSSRVETGLNHQHPAFKLQHKSNAYNAGFQAGNTYEIFRYLEYAINQQPDLEQVVLGLDFFMFNETLRNQDNFSEARLTKAYPIEDATTFLLSIDALNSSKETLIANLHNQDKKDSNRRINKFKFWIRGFLTNPQLYGQYKLSQDRLKYLQSIVQLCKKNNIDLKIFISPIHATQQEAIEVAGLWSTFEQWKKEVVKIAPVWDFAYHNSISTEKISDGMTYYIDSSHYSQKTGNLVLNRILNYDVNTVPSDFGVLLTNENIESHLIKNRFSKKQWQSNNLIEVQLVREIAQSVKQGK